MTFEKRKHLEADEVRLFTSFSFTLGFSHLLSFHYMSRLMIITVAVLILMMVFLRLAVLLMELVMMRVVEEDAAMMVMIIGLPEFSVFSTPL